VSDEQVIALILMPLAGMLGLHLYFEGKHKATRIAGAVWVAVWCLPPLVMLWIKAVLG
jgi:hypothetical protein